MLKIVVIGSGYVGLVSGVCFAHKGHQVICVDQDEQKIEGLKNAKLPIYEPGLEPLLKENMDNGRLSFSTDLASAVLGGDVIFISVNTPPREDGSADLSSVEKVAREIAKHLNTYKVIVDKSTVPVETGEKVERTIRLCTSEDCAFDVVSNPEFLREGSAVQDSLNPDRIVVGVGSAKAEEVMRKVYEPWDCPLVITDVKSAEITKHAANSFLATKISFINSIARICEKAGADIDKVVEGMKYDPRIGSQFLNAGIGYGGSCFPKDVSAFMWIARKLGYEFDLLKAVQEINEQQWQYFVQKVEDALWVVKDKTIAVWGLAFKGNTDDMRNAPSIPILQKLCEEGARIRAYDPAAMGPAKSVLPQQVEYCSSAKEAASGAQALLVLTDWQEFANIDMAEVHGLMSEALLADGRNLFDAAQMRKLGFHYLSIGRADTADLARV